MNENPNSDWICLFGKQKCSVSLMDRKRKYPEIGFFSLYFTFSWKKHKTFGFTNGKKEFLWNVLFFFFLSMTLNLFREVSCVKVTKMLFSREIFFMREWFLDCIFMYKIERIFFRWNIFSEWVFVKKKKKQEYPKNHSGSWTETFFFFNLVSHSPEKKKSFTWFLFSWGKKSLGWKKTKFWKKKDFCSRRRSRSLSKLKRGKRLRNAEIFFRTAELISSSFIIFLHRPMFTPVLTLQVVAGPRQSPLCWCIVTSLCTLHVQRTAEPCFTEHVSLYVFIFQNRDPPLKIFNAL